MFVFFLCAAGRRHRHRRRPTVAHGLAIDHPLSPPPFFQIVTIVLDNWEARVNGWGPQPLYRAPAVGFTYRWDRYEYLWVCLRGGDGG